MPAVLAAPATTILMPGAPGWDDTRQAWSLSVDQHPAAVALPASARDRFAFPAITDHDARPGAAAVTSRRPPERFSRTE